MSSAPTKPFAHYHPQARVPPQLVHSYPLLLLSSLLQLYYRPVHLTISNLSPPVCRLQSLPHSSFLTLASSNNLTSPIPIISTTYLMTPTTWTTQLDSTTTTMMTTMKPTLLRPTLPFPTLVSAEALEPHNQLRITTNLRLDTRLSTFAKVQVLKTYLFTTTATS